MIRLTNEQFEELKRIHNPEIFTEAQMGAWVEGLKDTLVKAEVDELDEQEKAVVDEFNHEFTSFVKVEVISRPSESELSKGLKYDIFFIRDKQVEWSGEDIIKSTDGVEEVISRRTGIYLDTKLNREMNRVGLAFGEKVEKSEEDELEKGGEGSKGGKILGHTKSGKPVYANTHAHHASYKDFSSADHAEAAHLHAQQGDIKNADSHTLRHKEAKNKEKSFDIDIEKAEGSRGGKIIGHTKSGKPIYDHADHPHLHSNGFQGDNAKYDLMENNYKHFTPEEHREAAQKLHDSKSGDKSVKSKERKTKLINGHLTHAYIKESGHPKDVPGQKNPMHEDVKNRTEAFNKKD